MKSSRFRGEGGRVRIGLGLVLGIAGLAMMLSGVSLFGGTAGTDARETITICHSTGSQSNPYVVNNPAKDGDVSGHDDHDGPIWFPGILVEWGDIIPPFTFEGGSYPGKNWTAEGIAIYENGCNIPGTPTATATATSTGTVTTPTATSTSTSTATATNTSVPPTDTPPPPQITIVIPAATNTPLAQVSAVVATPTATRTPAPVSEVLPAVLPRAGSGSSSDRDAWTLTVGGLLLMLFGGTLVAMRGATRNQ